MRLDDDDLILFNSIRIFYWNGEKIRMEIREKELAFYVSANAPQHAMRKKLLLLSISFFNFASNEEKWQTSVAATTGKIYAQKKKTKNEHTEYVCDLRAGCELLDVGCALFMNK